MKTILFILIVFINIFEYLATGKDGQKKDKTIIDWEKLELDARFPSWSNAHEEFDKSPLLENPSNFVPHQPKGKLDQTNQTQTTARELNLGVSSHSASISKKFNPPKVIHYLSPTYVETNAAGFKDVIQNLTGKDAPVNENEEKHLEKQRNASHAPVIQPILQLNSGTSMIGQNIGPSQHNSDSVTAENRENVHHESPSQIHQSKIAKIVQHFPGQHKLKQQNFGQYSSPGIGQESSSSAGVHGHGYYQQIPAGHPQILPQFPADPNWQITLETNFPHPNQNMSQSEVEKLFKTIKENLDELYEKYHSLKNELFNLFYYEINHANIMNGEEKKKLEEKRTKLENEKKAVEEQIPIMANKKQVYEKFIQLVAGKEQH